MKYTDTDRTIALAGIFQATQLVHQLAYTGKADGDDFETCINSLFVTDADTAVETFGDITRLRSGLQALIEQLGGSDEAATPPQKNRQLDATKYAIGIMVLERKLSKNPDMLKTVFDGIERARSQAEHFSITHENVIASLAHTYSQTISTLLPKIMVNGEHTHLANPSTADRIRALLLAAIRAAVLWRQCQGNRWQLFFKRKKILGEARRLLVKAEAI
ncbi:MAG TPA: lysogenization regulator HflD [Gammaproteobacteria bacterium]|nr:lysogenization regulator HflD [Gammaproteobacteria bacterium]